MSADDKNFQMPVLLVAQLSPEVAVAPYRLYPSLFSGLVGTPRPGLRFTSSQVPKGVLLAANMGSARTGTSLRVADCLHRTPLS